MYMYNYNAENDNVIYYYAHDIANQARGLASPQRHGLETNAGARLRARGAARLTPGPRNGRARARSQPAQPRYGNEIIGLSIDN